MATHSSTLAWKNPCTEEPGRLQSMGSWRVGHDWATSLSIFTFMHWRRKWQPTVVFLPGESQGRRSLVGCRLWSRRVGHDWSDLAANIQWHGVFQDIVGKKEKSENNHINCLMWKEGQNVWVLDILSFMLFKLYIFLCMGFPCSSDGKESAYNAGDFH